MSDDTVSATGGDGSGSPTAPEPSDSPQLPADSAGPRSDEQRLDQRIVWIDCEMTGLDLASDALVEIACVVTEADLTPLDDGISIVIAPPAEPLAAMDPVVVEMHENSGLIHEIPDGTTLADAHEQVLQYVRQHVPDRRKAPLAGSTIYVDRGFLARDMPELDAHLHYRVIDVSSIKELVKRWYPSVYYGAPEKTGNHRALGDILDSIAELRYYRSTVIAPTGAAAVGAESATERDPVAPVPTTTGG